MKKKFLAITGIRSEYDILYPVIDRLRKDKNCEVKVVVCGPHLSEFHGRTAKEIEKDGFKIADKIDYLLMTNRKIQRPKGAGILLYALAQAVEREAPDFLIVVGDREESIAAAMVGNYMDILVAHIAGGDTVYGNSDDPIRHAVSKLSHLHFVFTQAHGEVLRRTGEESFRIFNVGNPAIDRIVASPQVGLRSISMKLNFNLTDANYVVFIKHPLSSEQVNAYQQIKLTLLALEELGREKGLKTVGIYPNTDPGSFDIVRAIEEFKDSQYIRFYKNLERNMFVNLVRHSLAIVGNSSMGILEAPFFKLPTVNIGNRQRGRINCGNVRFVGYDKQKIKDEIEKACFDLKYRSYVKSLKNIYGNGHSAEKIASIFKKIDFREKKWLIKKLKY
jgi:GDP/UDP-N,N'-diacetylbacillosamine 2-epimerase (hydrolysing)